ncbi:hypothetical protein [Chitinophaga sp. YIM B06452]|uniref:hypothetical protein n=1 Tax=Chitinophaga sp. YIM B06452 TaxID=3082158 RepID=UPI0031FEF434
MTNAELFKICRITNPDRVDKTVERILARKEKYLPVVQATGVPWYFIGIIHEMENGGKFTGHLHNGDPLTARTKQVPAGRPLKGEPPFTWQESAIDALQYVGFASSPGKEGARLSWGLGATLDRLERYNGPGYRKVGINSPYLWSGCQHYTKGKFIKDGVFDPNAVSKQIGAGVILVKMFARDIIQL